MTTDIILIYDYETSGLSAEKDQPIEVAAEKHFPDGKIEYFQRLIRMKDGKKLPAKIIEITGITDALLEAEGIDYQQAMTDFFEFAGYSKTEFVNNVWQVGHNHLNFDREFSKKFALANAYLDMDPTKLWDTAGHYKAQKLGFKKQEGEKWPAYHKRALNTIKKGLKFNLTHICNELNLPLEGAHRAAGDVRATALLFKYQIDQEKAKRAEEIK